MVLRLFSEIIGHTMVLDNGVHQLGTRIEHLYLPFALMAIGVLASMSHVRAFAAGMLIVLLFGNVRTQAENYRWRVDSGEKR